MTVEPVCKHVDGVQEVTPGAEGCEECLAIGQNWVHLRLCMTCGHVGCCNESPHRHAQRHFAETGHPVMRSFDDCENWMWCYVDEMLIDGASTRRTDDTVSKEFLRRLPLFSGLSDEDLDRLYDMAKPIFIASGTVVMQEGDPGNELYVILEGELEVTKRKGEGDVFLGRRMVGEVIGEMAVLEAAPRSATVRATEDSLLLAVSKNALESLLACSPSATLSILRTMTSRLRSQESLLTQQEKMVSLGTLAAGLAHELNNPAAAIKRSASYLRDSLDGWERTAADLGKVGLDYEQIESMMRTQMELHERNTSGSPLDPLARSEREDAVQDWLEDHDVDQPWEVAPVLVTAGWDADSLEKLVGQFPQEEISVVARWIAARSTAHELLDEVGRSAEAISAIVKGVKTYSFLDEAPVQEIDVHEGLETTLVILKHKLKEGIHVTRDYGELPRIEAYGSELNQVWTNLIDNAIDAMEGKGELTIRTRARNGSVLIDIEDNGPGIPEEIQSRIFDVFFTTKPPGVGSGLGLHIAHNIIAEKHRGQLRVESEPGRTVFQIELPTHLRRG